MIRIEATDAYRAEKEYVFSVVFKEFLGLEYSVAFTGGKGQLKILLPGEQEILFPEILFNTSPDAWLTKQSYPSLPLSYRPIDDIPDLTTEHKLVPKIYGSNETQRFDSSVQKSELDLDIFGSIFFLITLYEEYGRTEADVFGRFLYTESILYKENLLQRPVVNEYLEILWHCLKSKCPALKRKERKYAVKLSHDVDVPFSHAQSTYHFVRSSLADILFRKSPSTFGKRFTSRFSKKKRFTNDPNNNFDYLMDVSADMNLASDFNFIASAGKGTTDERYEIDSSFFKKLLSDIHQRGHHIGIHPGFFTFNNPEQLGSEFGKLKRMCDELGIKQNRWGGRQHYLLWKNPLTWRIWNQAGLQYDSSIGSEYFSGFRSGVCYPYTVFDLETSQHLSLVEYPLIVMDTAAFKLGGFKKYYPQIVNLSKVCKRYNGTFTMLFHNNYIISPKQKREYESLLKSVI